MASSASTCREVSSASSREGCVTRGRLHNSSFLFTLALERGVGLEHGRALRPVEPARAPQAGGGDGVDLHRRELEAQRALVLLEALGPARGRDRALARLQAPPEQHLRGRGAVRASWRGAAMLLLPATPSGLLWLAG